jgi:hypothetical protein
MLYYNVKRTGVQPVQARGKIIHVRADRKTGAEDAGVG